MPDITGVSHVALAVTDLARSAEWYERTLGMPKVMQTELFPGHNVALYAAGPFFLGLHHDDRDGPSDRFDEFRVGLDHLSFHANNRAEIEAWASKLDSLGVAHSPIADEGYGHVLVFRDPDNIQLEFMAPVDLVRAPAPDDGPAIRGMNHIALTVSDIDASAAWYRRVFAFDEPIASMRESNFSLEMFFVKNHALALESSRAVPTGDRFNEFRTGLDHLAYGCKDKDEVAAWADRLDELGVAHSGVTDAPYGRALVFRDPDNIQLELFAL